MIVPAPSIGVLHFSSLFDDGNLFTKSRIEDIFARRAVLRHKQRGCFFFFFGKLLQSGQVGRRTFLLTTCQVSREIECVKRFLAICEPDTP